MFDLTPEDMKTARIDAGFTNVSATAKALGVTRGFIYDFERGIKQASLSTIFKMCELYGIELRITAENAKAWN